MPERVLFAVEQVAQVFCELPDGFVDLLVGSAVVGTFAVQAVKLDNEVDVVGPLLEEEVASISCRYDSDLFTLVGGVNPDVDQRFGVVPAFARHDDVLVVILADDVFRGCEDVISRYRLFQVDRSTDQRGELRHCYSLVDSARLCEQSLVALQDLTEGVARNDAVEDDVRHETLLVQVLVHPSKFAVDVSIQGLLLSVEEGEDLDDDVGLKTRGVAIAGH